MPFKAEKRKKKWDFFSFEKKMTCKSFNGLYTLEYEEIASC